MKLVTVTLKAKLLIEAESKKRKKAGDLNSSEKAVASECIIKMLGGE